MSAADRGTASERLSAATQTATSPLTLGLGATAGALGPAAAKQVRSDVAALAREGIDHRTFGAAQEALDRLPDEATCSMLRRYAAERALSRLRSRKIATTECPVLFESPLAAGLLGATFPLLCQAAVRRSDAGAGLSYLYLSNIAGSALGSDRRTAVRCRPPRRMWVTLVEPKPVVGASTSS